MSMTKLRISLLLDLAAGTEFVETTALQPGVHEDRNGIRFVASSHCLRSPEPGGRLSVDRHVVEEEALEAASLDQVLNALMLARLYRRWNLVLGFDKVSRRMVWPD